MTRREAAERCFTAQVFDFRVLHLHQMMLSSRTEKKTGLRRWTAASWTSSSTKTREREIDTRAHARHSTYLIVIFDKFIRTVSWMWNAYSCSPPTVFSFFSRIFGMILSIQDFQLCARNVQYDLPKATLISVSSLYVYVCGFRKYVFRRDCVKDCSWDHHILLSRAKIIWVTFPVDEK